LLEIILFLVLAKKSLEKKLNELNSYRLYFDTAIQKQNEMNGKIFGARVSLEKMSESKKFENNVTQKMCDELENLNNYQVLAINQLEKIKEEHKLILIKIELEQKKQ
jgi:hypothetical protein